MCLCVSQARGSPTFITAFIQMAVPFLSRVEGMEGGQARRQLLEQYMGIKQNNRSGACGVMRLHPLCSAGRVSATGASGEGNN